MAKRYLHLDLPHPNTAELIRHAFELLRQEMQIPAQFPPQVLAEAASVLARADTWPDHNRAYLDLEFITIDPQDSMDLDQAVHIAQTASGFTVHYAIADVAAFVTPGGAIDLEANARVTTFYAPEGRIPLHPPELSEGAASLLPGQIRPAAVWRIELDQTGEVTHAHVERGLVHSRNRLSYVAGQRFLDALAKFPGEIPDEEITQALKVAEIEPDFCAQGITTVLLLAVVGPLREAVEHARGGVSLNVPEQEVRLDPDGSFELEFRSVSPIEDWNAQISLLTGVVAADIMIKAGVGFVRTLPQADQRDLDRLRRTADALELGWDKNTDYATFIKGISGHTPRHAAFLYEATSLFRGAGYLAFDVDSLGPVPDEDKTKHHAIGANYAHVTAPLRRLADRYATEICLSVCAGQPVPQWVYAALDKLPSIMAAGSRRANAFTRSGVEIVEAALLAARVGQEFPAAVIDLDAKNSTRGEIMIAQPAVRAQIRATSKLPLGRRITARLTEADLDQRRIRFAWVDPTQPEAGIEK